MTNDVLEIRREHALEDRIDLACDYYESQQKLGTPVPLEELLEHFTPEEQTSALKELLALELELRFSRGEPLRKDEYLHRFPQNKGVVTEVFSSDVEQLMLTTAPAYAGAAQQRENAAQVRSPDQLVKIGKYRIIEALDSGGQATVYRAVHPELGRDVVIKFCHSKRSRDPQAQAALQAEGRVLANLEHPNLARVFDFDFHQDRAYLVIEYVNGLNLSQYRKQNSPSPQTWIPMVAQVAEALHYVHQKGILHLDIKPQNILVDANGTPRLIDFGLARADTAWEQFGTDPERICGTPAFMAPEQARNETQKVGPCSDVFGLGAVMFYMVTGQPPNRHNNSTAVFDKARNGSWNRDLLLEQCPSPDILNLIDATLAKEVTSRIGTAAELAAELRKLVPAPKQVRSTAISKSRALYTVAAAACLLLFALLVPKLWSVVEPGPRDVAILSSLGEMQIRVWRDGNTYALVDAVPVINEDRIEVRAAIPAGLHTALFLFDSAGELQLIEQLPISEEAYEFRFPKNPAQFEKIVGQSGTEFVFLCANRERAIDLLDIQKLATFEKIWPQLPDGAVIEVRSDEVEFLQRPLGFGGAVETGDPQQIVFERLRSLKETLAKRDFDIMGVAFAHQL